MSIENKVTELAPINGINLNEQVIQDHLDQMNEQGYYLVAVDNLVGWYRLFWAKDVVE